MLIILEATVSITALRYKLFFIIPSYFFFKLSLELECMIGVALWLVCLKGFVLF
jgi:hypothetical protein